MRRGGRSSTSRPLLDRAQDARDSAGQPQPPACDDDQREERERSVTAQGGGEFAPLGRTGPGGPGLEEFAGFWPDDPDWWGDRRARGERMILDMARSLLASEDAGRSPTA